MGILENVTKFSHPSPHIDRDVFFIYNFKMFPNFCKNSDRDYNILSLFSKIYGKNIEMTNLLIDKNHWRKRYVFHFAFTWLIATFSS